MKIRLLIALLLTSLSLAAQTDSIAYMRKDSIRQAKVAARQKRFDIGGGVQVNALRQMGVSSGLLFSFKANAKNGRIAGVFNASYNLNNNFDIRHFVYSDYPTYPESKFYSTARYNFLKLSAAMQIPFFNRTNKKGFSLAGTLGVGYSNGLGSGEYVSFLDKENPPVINSTNQSYIRPSQKFDLNNYNFKYINLDLGISANYTYQRYQLFIDGSINLINDVSGELNTSLTAESDSFTDFKEDSPELSYTINFGLRYCLYNPWDAKPPKRK